MSAAAPYAQSRLAFFDDSAKLADEYPFGDLYLYDYAAEGDGFVTLALSRYRSGSAAQLVTVNSGGNVLGECTPTGSVTSLSVNGKQVLTIMMGVSLIVDGVQNLCTVVYAAVFVKDVKAAVRDFVDDATAVETTGEVVGEDKPDDGPKAP